MKLKLKKSNVFYTGKIKGHTKISLIDFIAKAGGNSVFSINKEIDVFLAGERASQKKIDKALSLGLVVLQGEQIDTFLENGELEFDEDANKRSFDYIIGDARALLAKGMSRTIWDELSTLIDECEAEQIDELLAYVRTHIEAWPSCMRLEEGERIGSWEFMYDGIFGDCAGEQRRLTKTWLAEVVNGEQHEKHKLCQALSFTVAGLNSTLSAKVFDNPSISHIKVFDVGWWTDQFEKKKSFYKKMASATNLQNVETLVMSRAPEGAFDLLLKATSLPALKAIHLKRETYLLKEADKGARLFSGPWAKQLECVGINQPEQYAYLAEHIDEFPSLKEVALSVPMRADKAFFDEVKHLLPVILGGVEKVYLRLDSLEIYSGMSGGEDFLQQLAKVPLKELDMRHCTSTSLGGAAGLRFAEKNFVETGLLDTLEKLRVPPSFDADVVAFLRQHDVEVFGGDTSSSMQADNTSFLVHEDVAPGEEERRKQHKVHLHDAMMFEQPSLQAWKTLVGVVNGLELQLPPDEFEEAIKELEDYLEAWPDMERVLPDQWLRDFLAEKPSPKMRLIRSIHIQLAHLGDDPKYGSRWLERLAKAPAIENIRDVTFGSFGKQKTIQSAIVSFFEAVQPTSCHLHSWVSGAAEQAITALKGKGLYPKGARDSFSHRDVTPLSDVSALEARQVTLSLTDPAVFEAMLSHVEMDHVVSLALDFRFEYNDDGYDWSGLQAQVASWRRLRHLRMTISTSMLDQHTHEALAIWLSNARPVHVQIDTHSSSTKTPMFTLMEAGVMSRAYASFVLLPHELTREDARRLLSNKDLHVAGVLIDYAGNGYQVPDCIELVEMMHDGLKRCVRTYHWPMDNYEFERVGELCELLPELSIFAPLHPDFREAGARKPFLEGLAKSGSMASLARLYIITPIGAPDKLKAAELKILDKGVGISSAQVGTLSLLQPTW
ncbi:MAG TPA: hypothetical protein DCE42_15835 [Myxococcales bacterium]|nr:hypothetical protein [Deltaproteobacteria bacterium]HAA56235.1 hypothetical protein [Myxococcales bacterium]|tara:strand:- start:1197 stop:4037 length:2841 start_codon:yes stop_codon:yes gene_type:complete